MKTAAELRESFLTFFESKNHQRVSSASLIPQNDPTLFFTNAGMVPFKFVFTGEEQRDYQRATSSQKCMRVSGKHNDLENVGYTLRHHTFFEMLGNFSFGDYFKKEAIAYAWEFLTEVLKLDQSKLWISVFREDDEAEEIWQEISGFSKDKILRFDEEDNFWSMGPTGPCGPCSEIYYDNGASAGCGKSDCKVGCDCDRYMEIWNLVFMQYNRHEDGKMDSLPKPSVDTGMGLERLACVVQGKISNYQSDLFTTLFKKIEGLSQKKYAENQKIDVAMQVIADHLRACVFMIAEGIQPSNEGRGYVLRRILRRAIRYGRHLDLTEAFLFKIVPTLVDLMGAAYPELSQNQSYIIEAIKAEEERFLITLDKGLAYIQEEMSQAEQFNKKELSGAFAFKLYDTYGFPLDLTELILREKNMSLDTEEYKKLMTQQKERARKAWKGSGQETVASVYQDLLKANLTTEFVGYEKLSCQSEIIALVKDGAQVDSITQGDSFELFVRASPFYAESGGQVGDVGLAQSEQFEIEIKDTKSPQKGLIAHQSVLTVLKKGSLKVGDTLDLQVDVLARQATMKNHSATHLLHAALREVLGEHVKQAGSLVGPSRLRFDFSHYHALTREEILAVENLVNQKIQTNLPVEKNIQSYDEATQSGAMALFGEKYEEEVRVLKMGEFSTELCGGTHVSATGEIGLFKIQSESSVAGGVRRIEAQTGFNAVELFQEQSLRLQDLAFLFKSKPEELLIKTQQLQKQGKKLEKEVQQLKSKLAMVGSGTSSGVSVDPLSQAQEIKGVQVLALRQDFDDAKAMRQFSDQLRSKLKSGIIILGSANGPKVSLIVAVSQDLLKDFNAVDLCKKIAADLGGSGGGRPDMAQAGGSKPEALDSVLKKISQYF